MKFLSSRNYFRFTQLNLAYTFMVILWGAYVRATGSGAGCGQHWPLCNGEIIPTPSRIQTWIEFAHRGSSGVSLVLVFGGFFWARSVAIKGSIVRTFAGLSVIAIIMEALLGAMLVLLKLVEFDQSIARAISISLHLMNTLFLLACLSASVWFSRERPFFESRSKIKIPKDPVFLVAMIAFLILGTSGAITALGDTLFPAESLAKGLAQDLSAHAHFLIKLRVFHPIMAVIGVVAIFVWTQKLETKKLMPIRSLLILLIIGQFMLGLMNWMLLAPNALQLLHLLMADLVFIMLWISGLAYET